MLNVLVAQLGLQRAGCRDHDDLHSVEESNRATLAPLPTSFGTRILVFKTDGYSPSIKLVIWSLSANSHFGP